MSDTSSVQLYYYPETTWGVIPAGSPLPTLRPLRFTKESLKQTTQTAISAEIRSDRQVADIIRTKIGASGTVGFESSYGSHDDLLAGSLYSDWTTTLDITGVALTFAQDSPNATGTIAAAGSPNVGSPHPFANVVAGMTVRITSGANAGFYKVKAKVSPDTLRVYTPTAFTNSTYKTRIKGAFLVNGVTRKSYVIEKFFADLSPEQRQIYSGMRVSTAEVTITPGAILTGQFGFAGKQCISQGATIGNGVPAAASSNNVLNAVDNITDIRVNNVSPGAGVYFTEVGWKIDNKVREQGAVGSLPNIGIGLGRPEVTGTIKAYFQNRALLDYYTNFTEFGLAFRAVDSAGNSQVYDFPAIKLTDGQALATGNDQDVFAEFTFTAKRAALEGYMMGITRIPA